jgi:hypothetical protein
MKKWCLIIWMVLTGTLWAQYWGEYPPVDSYWINVEAAIMEDCDAALKLRGGVHIAELNDLGLATIGSGNGEYGYFLFNGEWGTDAWGRWGYVSWPPSLMTLDMVSPLYRNHWHSWGCRHCGCNEGGGVSADTMRPLYAFGFWWNNPNLPGNLWLINEGYRVWGGGLMACRIIPCPLGVPGQNKISFAFTDSFCCDTNFAFLPDNAIISGDSPLYMRVETMFPEEELTAKLYIVDGPEIEELVQLDKIDATHWCGKLENSRILGLKSFATVKGEVVESEEEASDEVMVSLPILEVSPVEGLPAANNDTFFISHETMQHTADIRHRIRIERDLGGNKLDPRVCVDSVAYKIRTVWVANANLPNDTSTFHRQYPADGSYLRWDGSEENCAVHIFRWNFYAVGGALTGEAKGAYKNVLNVDNTFHLVTDSITTGGDSIKTKTILIDSDPNNDTLKAWLGTDQARAIAWQEGAGTTNYQYPPNAAMDHWNHYWENDAAHPTNTRTPCEGDEDVDAGIMQINRRVWRSTFDGSRMDTYPPGRYYASWDSLAWSWKVSIINGTWILDSAIVSEMTSQQRAFPDSCSYANCDSIPDTTNKEDLANYGYHAGGSKMTRLNSQSNWNIYIFHPKTDLDIDYAEYCKLVRRIRYRGNLW